MAEKYVKILDVRAVPLGNGQFVAAGDNWENVCGPKCRHCDTSETVIVGGVEVPFCEKKNNSGAGIGLRCDLWEAKL